MLFQSPGVIRHDGGGFAVKEPPHLIFIRILGMMELVLNKIFVDQFEEGYLLGEKTVFIFLHFTGEGKGLFIGNIPLIFPMFVLP